MAFNIWQPQGQLVGLTTQSNPNVIYEDGAKVLSGTVFKMWCTKNNGFGDLNYYESLDGLTSWTPHPSNPIGSGTGFNFPTVYHIGSTYYCYSGAETDAIYVRTSSDGITWGSATVAVARGGVGTWDSVDVAQLNILPGGTVGGLYYAYYEGILTASQEGLVTSPDLITWTKSVSNPILAGGYAPLTAQLINGTYYLWLPDGGILSTVGLKGYNGLVRLSSTNPAGPWTTLSLGGSGDLNRVLVNYPVLQQDVNKVVPGATSFLCAMSDPCMISALGNMYMYWTKSDIEVTNQFGISASIATGVSPAQLVAGYEGVRGFPIPGPGFTLNLTTLASDNFVRANANPMGGNWTPIGTTGGFSTNQIASNLVEPSSTSQNSESFYNAVSFPNDQWSQITVQAVAGAGLSAIGPSVRMSASKNEYRCNWQVFTVLGAPGTMTILPVVAGAGGTSSLMNSITVSVGDTLMLAVSGQNLLAYLNSYPVLALATTAGLTSGSAGFTEFTSSASVVNAKLNGWSGGGFQEALFGISGALGASGAGATVSWSGTSSGSTTADGSGNYNTGEVLLPFGTYTIMPSKTGFVFSPSNRTNTMASADIANVNFTTSAGGASGLGEGGNFRYTF